MGSPGPASTDLILPQSTASDSDALTVAALLKANLTVPEIAYALNKTPGSVKSLVTQAQALLEANAIQAVTDWMLASSVAAKKGNHKPARDLLVAANVIEPPYSQAAPGQHSAGAPITVQIGFALPGMPQPSATKALPNPDHD